MIGNAIVRQFMLGIAAIVTLALFPVSQISAQTTAMASQAPNNDDLVKRGQYLVRAGDCMPCHTGAKGQEFAGGLPLNTPFGQVFSRNITPDKGTGIGDWSLDDFKQTMWNGKSRNGAYLYPTMPFPFYTAVTEDDLEAIFAYLQTLEPVAKANKPNGLMFPMSLRESMLGWRELYFTAGRFQPDTTKSDSWNRGAYLVEGLGHCGACHTPRNLLGGRIESERFAGAKVDDWWAPNISANNSQGVGDWTEEDLKTFLKTGVDTKKSTIFGPMAEVVHDSLSFLTDEDLDAIATYLLDVRPVTEPAAEAGVTMNAAERQNGGEVYVANCIACHQEKGAGIEGAIPPLAGNPAVTAVEPYNILSAVLHGIAATDQFAAMPNFASKLGDQDIADLANYIRTSWGNNATPDVTETLVKHWRDGIDELPSGTEASRSFGCPAEGGVDMSDLTGDDMTALQQISSSLGASTGQNAMSEIIGRLHGQGMDPTEIANTLTAAYCPDIANSELSPGAKNELMLDFTHEVLKMTSSVQVQKLASHGQIIYAEAAGDSVVQRIPSTKPGPVACPSEDSLKHGDLVAPTVEAIKSALPGGGIPTEPGIKKIVTEFQTAHPKLDPADAANTMIDSFCHLLVQDKTMNDALRRSRIMLFGEAVIRTMEASASTRKG